MKKWKSHLREIRRMRWQLGRAKLEIIHPRINTHTHTKQSRKSPIGRKSDRQGKKGCAANGRVLPSLFLPPSPSSLFSRIRIENKSRGSRSMKLILIQAGLDSRELHLNRNTATVLTIYPSVLVRCFRNWFKSHRREFPFYLGPQKKGGSIERNVRFSSAK